MLLRLDSFFQKLLHPLDFPFDLAKLFDVPDMLLRLWYDHYDLLLMLGLYHGLRLLRHLRHPFRHLLDVDYWYDLPLMLVSLR